MDRPGGPRKTPGGWLCSAGPLSVTSENPNSCEALKNRAKLTRKGTHVTTYKPINIGVRRPQGREAKGGNKPRVRPLLQAQGLRWLLCVIGKLKQREKQAPIKGPFVKFSRSTDDRLCTPSSAARSGQWRGICGDFLLLCSCHSAGLTTLTVQLAETA